MLSRIFFVLVFAILFISLSAQTDNHYLISSDAELAALGNPRIINGNLELKGISAIEYLSNLEEVLGDLIISNLQGEVNDSTFRIPSLKKIAGDLIIRDNVAATSLYFDSLSEVKSIDIINNLNLEFVSLQRLNKIHGHFKVNDNSVITILNLGTVTILKMSFVEIVNNPELVAFFPPNIEEIDYIDFSDNPDARMMEWKRLVKVNQHIAIKNSDPQGVGQFTHLEVIENYLHIDNIPFGAFIKFEKLKSIGRKNEPSKNGFMISNIEELSMIELPQLQQINGELAIINTKTKNYVYTNMPKLETLSSLKIIANESLENLNFLESLKSIADSVIIKDNKNLASCALPFICSLSDDVFTNKLTIENNLDCCKDLDQLREECEETCCPFSTTYIFDKCDVFIYKTDDGECYQVSVNSSGKPESKKVDCPK